MELFGETTPSIEVRENQYDVDTGLEILPLDYLTFNAVGDIWAGVIFTGQNGPKGWNNIDLDPKFPLVGSHPYALIGRLAGRYFYVGQGLSIYYRGNASRLYLRTNDDMPGNGSGAFNCAVQQFRRVQVTAPAPSPTPPPQPPVPPPPRK
jgi:hypothetical protein